MGWKEAPLAGQVLRGSWNWDSQLPATTRRFEAACVRAVGVRVGDGRELSCPDPHCVSQCPWPGVRQALCSGPLKAAAEPGPAGEGPASQLPRLLAALTVCGREMGGRGCAARVSDPGPSFGGSSD